MVVVVDVEVVLEGVFKVVVVVGTAVVVVVHTDVVDAARVVVDCEVGVVPAPHAVAKPSTIQRWKRRDRAGAIIGSLVVAERFRWIDAGGA